MNLVLGYLVRENDGLIDEVLFNYKHTGVANGCFNGFGGKIERLEDEVAALIREAKEELNIIIDYNDIQNAGSVTFAYPWHEAKTQKIDYLSIFRVDKWEGDMVATEGGSLKWFSPYNFPYDETMPHDIHWLPAVFRKLYFHCNMVFDGVGRLIQVQTTCESPHIDEESWEVNAHG